MSINIFTLVQPLRTLMKSTKLRTVSPGAVPAIDPELVRQALTSFASASCAGPAGFVPRIPRRLLRYASGDQTLSLISEVVQMMLRGEFPDDVGPWVTIVFKIITVLTRGGLPSRRASTSNPPRIDPSHHVLCRPHAYGARALELQSFYSRGRCSGFAFDGHTASSQTLSVEHRRCRFEVLARHGLSAAIVHKLRRVAPQDQRRMSGRVPTQRNPPQC